MFEFYIRENAKRCREVVTRDSAKGKSLVIAGAGPSLAETVGVEADMVWACNGALNWMLERGHIVTQGFTTNSYLAIADLWKLAPDVEYILASTCHPELAARLAGRRIHWFHNLVDLPNQERLYAKLYPETIWVGSGLNAVTRALDVAHYMGFERITVIGADCALRGDAVHVDGGAADWATIFGTADIDGREWISTPDMWISAVWLTRLARSSNGTVTLLGDTLPNALMDKDEAFLDELPRVIATNPDPFLIGA